MKKHAIILAAGKGTRMKSDLPKCACLLCSKPMVKHIVDSCNGAGIDEKIVVVGFEKEVIIDILKDEVKYAYQENQLGTGDAVRCTEPLLKGKKGICIIFPGDMPLVTSDIIKNVMNDHIKNKNAMTIVTTLVDDPTGYGRIYQENGTIKKIVECSDANPEQKKIKEINSGLYCVNTELLFEALSKVGNDNAKHEYYLTDIVEILSKEHKIGSYIVHDSDKLMGINDIQHLKIAENICHGSKMQALE